MTINHALLQEHFERVGNLLEDADELIDVIDELRRAIRWERAWARARYQRVDQLWDPRRSRALGRLADAGVRVDRLLERLP